MPRFTPQIGMRGLYSLRAPFDAVLLSRVQYNCIAIRQLSDIIAADEDPFKSFYEPYGIGQDVYQADLLAGVCLITYQSDLGDIAYVPDSYIAGFPDIGGVPYRTIALAVNLGAIPDTLDLSYLQTKVASDVMEILGVASDVKLVSISHPTTLTLQDHTTIEAARQAAIQATQTDYSKYLQAQTELDAARQHIQELEQYIMANPAP